ncbi:MAG: hypothetical protein HY816_19130 [Candidatus Wallbacteria bacterium]|nr:hypothetical protein [Candidatus Wallbacteria bacterium]
MSAANGGTVPVSATAANDTDAATPGIQADLVVYGLLPNTQYQVAYSPGLGRSSQEQPIAGAWSDVQGVATFPGLTWENGVDFAVKNMQDNVVLRLDVTASPSTQGGTTNRSPVANAGGAQTVTAGTQVTLAGSGTDADNDTLTYAWTSISGPAVNLSDANTRTARFTPAAAGTYVFRLTVSDGRDGSGVADVTITVTAPAAAVSGTVKNGSGTPIANVTVYLVPTTAVLTTAISPSDVLTGRSEPYDEPLEDAVSTGGSTFFRDVTDSVGQYSIASKPDKYYVYAAPALDSEYLPGGSQCRTARTTAGTVDIVLSGKPSDAATYVGSSRCLQCHSSYASQKYTAHRHGISVPGQWGGFQNPKNFPNINKGVDLFLSATSYTGGTPLSFGDYNGTRGFDKFEVYLGTGPTQITTKRGEAWLWKNTATNKYTITLVNTANTSDPNSPLHLPVNLTYGGPVYKQRYLVQIPNTGKAPFNVDRSGHYPLLQFQKFEPGLSEGSDDHYDRPRTTFRDYHLDWLYNDSSKLFKIPSASQTFEAQCAACHMPGIALKAPNAQGERLADGIEDDTNGEFDIDGDGAKNELNVGCETCHGPGSDHAALAARRRIVSPSKLSPERENMICASCHDRPQGNGSVADLKKDVPFDSQDRFPKPGISRSFWLTSHTSRKGPATGDFWSDQVHSKSHHQQYADFLKSSHYRNDRRLLACSDCHDLHATRSGQNLTEYRHNLRADPATGALCARCHTVDLGSHTQAKVGVDHSSASDVSCVQCHMTKTAMSGPGQKGRTLGSGNDANSVYWMNDISSHTMRVIRKSWKGVAGSTPGSAMPAAYTNKCGACHNVSTLKSATPTTP